MTTAARTATAADVRQHERALARSTAKTPATGAPSADDTFGAWLVTAMIASFFATIAVVLWMAHTVHV